MSKRTLLTLLLFLSILSTAMLFAAETKSFTVSNASPAIALSRNTDYGCQIDYQWSELLIGSTATKGGSFSQINIPGFGNTGRLGEPQLPVIRKFLSVPLGAEVRINIASSTIKEFSGKDLGINLPLMPAQASVSKSEDPAKVVFLRNSQSYGLDTYNIDPVVSVSELGIMRGVRLVSVDFEPVKYNPLQNRFKVYDQVTITVDFLGGDLRASQELLEKTASYEYNALYEKTIFNWRSTERTSLVRYPTKMLILCPAAYVTTLQPFVDWKKQQGYTVDVTTVGTGGTVANTTAAINTYMAGVWSAATAQNPAPTYLLIVGDTSTSGNNIIANTGTSASHVTDLTYVRLQGTDMLPEMYFGRFSVSSATELTNIINKSITFEKTNMPDLSYLGNVVMIAGADASYAPTYGNGQINYGTTHYFNATNGLTSNTYLYPASETSDAAVIANANAGRGYINYTAHGSETSWADPTFSVSDVNAMTNTNKYGVMVGNCCITSKFDYTGGPCFGEALIRKANAAAVAYIGCTNNSYWDEDYWWGIGYKTPIQTAAHAYNATTLGAYDAMFHTHGEATADWATTIGETNYMGLLAVEQSSSTRKPYYWEIYSIMGDPSLMPYYGVPAVHNATYPSQILIGATSVNITADPQSRVAITMGGVLYGTGIVGTSGTLSLTITPFTSVGTADIVITRQNRRTVLGTISIIPNSGAYVTLDSWSYADSGNNSPESGEAGRINATFRNVGSVAATNVVCTLSSTNLNVTFTDNSETIASLAAGATTTVTNAFAFTFANNMTDQTSVPYSLAMVSGSSNWNSSFNLTVNAPAITFGSMIIADPTGNNNGRIDPGETVTITIPLQNTGHMASAAGSATLSSTTTGITINTGTASFTAIAASGSANLTFSVSAASSMTIGSIASLSFNATAGAYTASKTETATIGIITEDFESGGFTAYPWTLSGNVNWSVVNTGAHAGTYCAKSGTITHSGSTVIETVRNVTTAGNITFWYSVSSESGYDYLKFYIDGALQTSSWSGTVAWTQASYAVTTGSHTFKWEYMKDGSVSSGSDCAWVDDIIFPASTGSVTFNPPQTLAATASHAKVALTWVAPVSGTPTSYKVFRNSTLLTTVTTLLYNDTAVTNGTAYTYYVTAVYTSPSAGESVASNSVSATPSSLPPRTLTAAAGNANVVLAWLAPLAGTPSGYKVYKNSTLLTTVTALTYTDNAVTNGTTYSYYVTATYTTPTGESAASNTVTATPSVNPPLSLTGTAGNATVTLNWLVPVSGTPTGYKVYRNSVLLSTVTALTYTDTAVTNGTSYSYYVTAIYGTTESSASNSVSLTPNAASTITIGTGTSANRTPFGMYYGYERDASLYLSSEIGTTGSITTLSWYVNSAQTTAAPVNIMMKTTTSTAVTASSWATMISGATTVYSSASVSFATAGWKTITLTSPFNYASGNLLVLIETTYGGAGTSTYPNFRYTTAGTGTHQYWYQDNSAPTGNGTVNTSRPNIQMQIGAAPSTPVFTVTPSAVSFSSVELGSSQTQQVTVSNTGSGTLAINSITLVNSTNFQLLGLPASYPVNLTTGASVSFTVKYLPTAVGTHTASVIISDNLARTAHTLTLNGTCVDNSITVPYTQDFATFIPANWSQYAGLLAAPSTLTTGSNWVADGFGNNGTTGAARLNIWTTTTNNWLLTPTINLGTSTTARLEFDMSLTAYNTTSAAQTTGTDDKFAVVISTDNGTTWTSANTLMLWDNAGSANVYNNIPAAGTHITIPLSAYSGRIKLAFYGESTVTNADNDLTLDNVALSNPPILPVISVSPTSLTFTETAVGTSAQQTLLIQNSGGAALTGSLTTPEGFTVQQDRHPVLQNGGIAVTPDGYSVQQDRHPALQLSGTGQRNTLNFDIAAGQSVSYSITFTPTQAIAYSGNVVISSNDTVTPIVNVAVSGTGYTPPAITLNSETFQAVLLSGETQTQTLILGNTGSRDLTYSIALQEVPARDGRFSNADIHPAADRNITGTTFTANATSYVPGTTVDLLFTVTNGSTDSEWLKNITLQFPTGVSVNSSTSFVGGTGGDMTSNLATGDGAQIIWHGETSGAWGVINDGETATATVNISIAPSFTGELSMAFVVDGDIYGTEPHSVTGNVVLAYTAPAITWLQCSPVSGTISSGQNQNISLAFDAFNLAQGTYHALITISSNDPLNGESTVAVTLDVTAGNHSPVINLPASFSFDKNGSLPVNFALYASDADADILSLSVSGNTHIQAAITGLGVTFTADPNWIGSEMMSFTVSDGQYSASDNVTVTVLPTDLPVWTPVVYPNNPATVYGIVTIDSVPAAGEDQVAAFVGNECRGTGSIVIEGGLAYITMLVNLDQTPETVTFKVYDQSMDTIYTASSTQSLSFGQILGQNVPYPISVSSALSLVAPVLSIAQQGQDVVLSWNIINGATHYLLYYSQLPDSGFILLTDTVDTEYTLPSTVGMGFFKVIAATAGAARGGE